MDAHENPYQKELSRQSELIQKQLREEERLRRDLYGISTGGSSAIAAPVPPPKQTSYEARPRFPRPSA
jgi:hypothetical protein